MAHFGPLRDDEHTCFNMAAIDNKSVEAHTNQGFTTDDVGQQVPVCLHAHFVLHVFT